MGVGEHEAGSLFISYSRRIVRLSDRQLSISRRNVFMMLSWSMAGSMNMSIPVLDISIEKGTEASHEAACEIHEDRGQSEDGNYQQLTRPGNRNQEAEEKWLFPRVLFL